jgi:pyruvate dehydrogenase E2 component (dihydrolipoamide acetyltransferase)
MSSEIHLPDIGADQAEVTEIFVKIGDVIELDAPLLAVEGDKAAMEVPSPQAGTVEEIKISVGDEVSTGDLILLLTPAEPETTKAADKEPTT